MLVRDALQTLRDALEGTMKVFIDEYADKLAGLKRKQGAAEPARKQARA